MVYVTSISIANIRSHDVYSADLSPKTTIITGKNGSGKTSLIEALYIALQGSSFRGTDKDIVKKDTEWYRIEIVFSDGSKRTVKYDSLKQFGKKQFLISDKVNYRLLSKDKYPIVLFEPDDLRLLSGSPTRRRHFIDTLISQVDPQYYQSVRKYERALKQRNNLLKKPHTSNDDLFVWNIALSEYGSYIISERTAFIEKLNERISDIYNSI
ncbi:MAG: AAA family ATPase, partial [Candidatus Saccharibacteria bacterium]